MSAIARCVRPFASRALSQKLPISRMSPAMNFPRGSIRTFSQSAFLEEKKYTESHEWVELAGDGKAKIGITEYAAKSLGDVVFVELPTADTEVGAGEPVGAVESVKSASDVLSPVSGTIVQGNALLDDEPKAINGDPEGAAWIAEIKVSDASKLDELWDKQAYKKSIEDAE